MQPYQQAHLDAVKPKSILDRLNEVLTYIEFFKSSMTDCELLTAIQDQMDKHVISKQFISNFYDVYTSCSYMHAYPVTLASVKLYDVYTSRSYIHPGTVTLASVKLYEIITELESKCKHDLTNKQQ